MAIVPLLTVSPARWIFQEVSVSYAFLHSLRGRQREMEIYTRHTYLLLLGIFKQLSWKTWEAHFGTRSSASKGCIVWIPYCCDKCHIDFYCSKLRFLHIQYDLVWAGLCTETAPFLLNSTGFFLDILMNLNQVSGCGATQRCRSLAHAGWETQI